MSINRELKETLCPSERNRILDIHRSTSSFIDQHNQCCQLLVNINKMIAKWKFAELFCLMPFNLLCWHQVLFEDSIVVGIKMVIVFIALGDMFYIFGHNFVMAYLSKQMHLMAKPLPTIQWRLKRWPFGARFKLQVMIYFERLSSNSKTIVNTTSGLVRGQTLHINNSVLVGKVDQFLGIPYAVPPIGELRFAKPLPITTPAKKLIDATKPGFICMQIYAENLIKIYGNFSSREDCLTLSIWTTNREKSKLKPVMFWIYGGAFTSGSTFAPIYNGSALAIHDVVVVSVNYRLGIFGFIFGDREDAPGNVGLFDQQLALRWLRDNIHQFGGNRDQITIFGESAGSWSVSDHILSPLSKGLFRRAIMQSGAQMHYKVRQTVNTTENLLIGKQLAKDFNCSDSEDWIHCLRKVDSKLLVNKTIQLLFPLESTQFLPISAIEAFKQNKFNSDIDLIAGINRDEGQIALFNNISMTVDLFNLMLKQYQQQYHGFDVQKVSDFYLKGINKTSSESLKRALGDIMGDLLLKCPTYMFAKQVAKLVNPNNNVYFYELTYMSQYFGKLMNCDPKKQGICHGQDLPIVFGLPLLTPELYSSEDILFSREVQQMWTNFAKNGVPHTRWPKLLSDPMVNSTIKDLNPVNETKIFHHLFDQTCDSFWYNYYL
ncbi:cholinesterase-like [Oppia nitens]|uniref:cholinesterase-like n=1 Tax=Oppia nitens TaxID=1686743 RepID=UPI0023DC8AC0|nr:cholinesterase-like [Oppia nitens]